MQMPSLPVENVSFITPKGLTSQSCPEREVQNFLSQCRITEAETGLSKFGPVRIPQMREKKKSFQAWLDKRLSNVQHFGKLCGRILHGARSDYNHEASNIRTRVEILRVWPKVKSPDRRSTWFLGDSQGACHENLRDHDNVLSRITSVFVADTRYVTCPC